MASRQSKSTGGPPQPTSVPTRHLEVETKLEIAPDTPIPDLVRGRGAKAAGFAGVNPPVEHDLDAVYYDTDQLDLLSAKLTLRRRSGGDDAGWHLKVPDIGSGRTEIAVPLESRDAEPVVPAALSDLVAGAARGRALRPVARIRNHRVVRRITDADGRELVEIADDHVRAAALEADGSERTGSASAWRELEAELIDGTREQLAAAVDVLRRAGATPASSTSKLARALDSSTLLADKAKVVARRDKSAGGSVLTALARLRDGLISTDRALREGTDVAIHDARAAARRVRSVLGVFAPLFTPGAVNPLRAALREHGRVLSIARDLEVLQLRLTAQLVDEPAEYARPAADRLAQEFNDRIPVALAEVGEHIRSSAYFTMLQDLDTFLSAPPLSRRAAKSATAELPGLLDDAWRALREQADTAMADPENAPAIHEVRKQAKALRYATEAAAAALGEDAVVFAAAIEEIQEVLGEHQDATTSAALLAELAVDPRTLGIAGFIFGRLHAFEQAVAHGSLDDFADAWDRVEDGDLLAALFRG